MRAERILRIVLVALVATSSPATAFELIGFSWGGGSVSYRINPNFPNEELSGTASRQIDLLRAAASSWDDQTRADFQFVYDGTTARSGLDLNDNVHAVSWVNQNGNEALAVTLIGVNRQNRLAFDIVFFERTAATPNLWSGHGEPVGGTVDILGVAVHEFGHALGLDHTDVSGSTMFASVFGRGLPMRTLEADDRAGAEDVYDPDAETPAPSVEILSVSPDFGPTLGGNEIALEGRNFTYASKNESQVLIDGMVVTTTRLRYELPSRIVITNMPPHTAGTVDITVVNSIGSATLQKSYTYGGPPPRLLSIEPATGPVSGGIPIIVNGTGFTAETIFFVGESPLENVAVLDTDIISGTLGPSALGGVVDLRMEDGKTGAVLAGVFEYVPNLISLENTAASPGQRAVRMEALVTTPEPLSGVSFACSFDQDILTLRQIVRTPLTLAADFGISNIDNPAGEASYDLIVSVDNVSRQLEPGAELPIARLLIDVSPDAEPGVSTPVTLRVLDGPPRRDLSFTLAGDGDVLAPYVLEGGVVSIIDELEFRRGDANGDGELNISDAQFGLNNLFLGGPPPRPCRDAADSNDDGRHDVSDASYLLNYLFLGGDPPPAPHPSSGIDPTPDENDC